MRGGEAVGLRAYNERLIISAIRQSGSLSKAQIARVTGLSSQGAAVIVNTLINDGLLQKLGKIRGQVGQPSTPISLNPSGAYSVGVKIGRRSVEGLLVDFNGEPVRHFRQTYAAPLPAETLALAGQAADDVTRDLSQAEKARIVGLGVAMPGDLHKWYTELDLPPSALADWETVDVGAVLEKSTALETVLYNDATAACAAELISGDAIDCSSALHIYVGTFVGGGVVLDGRLYRGDQSNAGAIGSMPAGNPQDPSRQLIHEASAIDLERALAAAGLDVAAAIAGDSSEESEAVFADWTSTAAPALARAIIASSSVIDFEVAVIDGMLPKAWVDALVDAVKTAMDGFSSAGLSPVDIRAGSIGVDARVMGAALLPLNDRFSPDAELVARTLQTDAAIGEVRA